MNGPSNRMYLPLISDWAADRLERTIWAAWEKEGKSKYWGAYDVFESLKTAREGQPIGTLTLKGGEIVGTVTVLNMDPTEYLEREDYCLTKIERNTVIVAGLITVVVALIFSKWILILSLANFASAAILHVKLDPRNECTAIDLGVQRLIQAQDYWCNGPRRLIWPYNRPRPSDEDAAKILKAQQEYVVKQYSQPDPDLASIGIKREAEDKEEAIERRPNRPASYFVRAMGIARYIMTNRERKTPTTQSFLNRVTSDSFVNQVLGPPEGPHIGLQSDPLLNADDETPAMKARLKRMREKRAEQQAQQQATSAQSTSTTTTAPSDSAAAAAASS